MKGQVCKPKHASWSVCDGKITQESCEGMKSFSDNSEVCKWKSI